MATKIRRCLYIGLGGTGMKALLHTKKMFVDTYGDVPPMIGFLGIDTDGGTFIDTLPSYDKKSTISLKKSEQMTITVDAPKPIWEHSKDRFTWLPGDNVFALKSITKGAGQIRTNGRFAFTVRVDDVRNTVEKKLNDITSAQIIHNEEFEVLETDAPEIHMVFSICGGTGAGTFMNMAYLLRQCAPSSKLYGYAVLPGVFRAMMKNGVDFVAPNAYASLVDLDYLMHCDWTKTPVTLENVNPKNDVEIKDTPFDSIVFVDNKTPEHSTCKDIRDLTEMISFALITAAGQLSTKGASIGDNLETLIASKAYEVKNKRSWAGGIGACEIIYDGSKLGEIYKLKATQNIICRLLNSCTDGNLIANNWIDSAEVQIRENNGRDDVTDYIAAKDTRFPLTIDDKSNPRASVDPNITANKIKSEDLTKKRDELLARVRVEFDKLMRKHINTECGVSTAMNVIDGIKLQLGCCLKEMLDEKEELTLACEKQKHTIDSFISEVENIGFWGRGRAALCAQLCEVVDKYNADQRDIQRHETAITFYNTFIVELDECRSNIQKVHDKLRLLESEISKETTDLERKVAEGQSLFQINLAETDAKAVTVEAKDILIEEFIDKLPGDKVWSFVSSDKDVIKSRIMEYASTLPGVSKFTDKNIEDLLYQLREQDKKDGTDKLEKLIKRAISLSIPFLRHNYEGWPHRAPADILYIGVCHEQESILRDNQDLIANALPGYEDMQFAATGMKHKIIFYRQIGVFPAYSISGIVDYKAEYEDCHVFTHIDENIKRRMMLEKYDIKPASDDHKDNMEWWVKGIIYGKIKNVGNKMYMVQSEKLGDAFEDYWIELAPWRDDAFTQFQKMAAKLTGELQEYIAKEDKDLGAEATKKRIAYAKENYFDEISQVGYTKDELRKEEYKRIKAIITKELEYVKTL